MGQRVYCNKKNINKGEILSESNITTKRPTAKKNQLSAKLFYKILGKKIKKGIKINNILKHEDVL